MRYVIQKERSNFKMTEGANIICPVCHTMQDEQDGKFCTSCGAGLPEQKLDLKDGDDLESAYNLKIRTDEPIAPKQREGKFVLPDGTSIIIDESQLLVGRAQLRAYTATDPGLISRSHLTAYRDLESFVVIDGRTNVQEKPSSMGTFFNDKRLPRDEIVKLSDGDMIKISDVLIRFEET